MQLLQFVLTTNLNHRKSEMPMWKLVSPTFKRIKVEGKVHPITGHEGPEGE